MLTSVYISLAAFIRAQVPTIKTIDLWNGQYLMAESRKDMPFNTPSVFIEWGETDWVDQGRGTQEGDTMITLHVVTDSMIETRNLDLVTDSGRQTNIINQLNVDDAILAAVQRFTPDGCCREMWRRKTEYDHARDQLTIVKMTFYTRFIQRIANPAGTSRQVTGVGVTYSDALITTPDDPYTGPGLNTD